MRAFLEKIIPLKDVNQRSSIPDFLYGGKTLRPENDGDYICFLLVARLFCLGIFIIVLLSLDAYFKTNYLIDPELLQKNKYLFAIKFRDMIQWFILVATFIAYFRIRLFVDIKNDHVPVILNRKFYWTDLSKTKWISLGLLSATMSLLVILAPPVVIRNLAHYFYREDDLSFIIFLTTIFVLAYAAAAAFLLSAILYLEKIIRFFPQFQQDCDSMTQRLLREGS